MGKLFKITGFFEQYGKIVAPGFMMEIQIEDDMTFTGTCKELYKDARLTKENTIRYIVGKLLPDEYGQVAGMGFYKLSQDPNQSAIFYVFEHVWLENSYAFFPENCQATTGMWGIIHDRHAKLQGSAAIQFKRITERKLGQLSYHCVADTEGNRLFLDDARFGNFRLLERLIYNSKPVIPLNQRINDGWDELVFCILNNNRKVGLGEIDKDELHIRINQLPFLGLFFGDDLMRASAPRVAKVLFKKLPVNGKRHWWLTQLFMPMPGIAYSGEIAERMLDNTGAALRKLRYRNAALVLKAFYYTDQLTRDEKIFLASRSQDSYYGKVLATLAK